MKYKHITEQQHIDAAGKGLKEALRVSVLKWWYYGTTPQPTRLSSPQSHCALCFYRARHSLKCDHCPLTGQCAGNHMGLYDQAINAYRTYARNRTQTNWKLFQRKARNLARHLQKLEPTWRKQS